LSQYQWHWTDLKQHYNNKTKQTDYQRAKTTNGCGVMRIHLGDTIIVELWGQTEHAGSDSA
jgi:hypothetical protein